MQAVKTWLQTHRNWLLILDNADELTVLPDFLPPSIGGDLLVTTRASFTGHLARQLKIEAFTSEQGALFLLLRAGLLAPDATLDQASAQKQRQARHISQELGDLPLALDQAGAYLEETGTSLVGYRQMYQRHRADLLDKRGGVAPEHPEPVATTWSLAFQKVREKQPAAADLLNACAFLAPDAIPEEILTTGASFFGPVFERIAKDAFFLNQTIEALRTYSLVHRNPSNQTLSIHRLVQAVVQDAMDEETRQRWAEQTVRAVQTMFLDDDYEKWQYDERLLPHALACVSLIEHYSFQFPEAGHLLHNVGYCFMRRDRYTEAEQLYQQAQALWEQRLEATQPDMALVLDSLASLYQDQGKYEEAEPLFKQALAIREAQLEPNHTSVAASLNNLGNFYVDIGQNELAEMLLQRALAIDEQIYGPDDLDITTELNNLGIVYTKQGKYREAEVVYQRSLAIRKQHLEPDHPTIAATLHGLARLYEDQGAYVKAEQWCLQALSIREERLGPASVTTAISVGTLARINAAQQKYAEAERMFKRALTAFEHHLGDHLYTATCLLDLALLHQKQAKYETAEPVMKSALMTCERALDPKHPQTKKTREYYTALLGVMGQQNESHRLEFPFTKPEENKDG